MVKLDLACKVEQGLRESNDDRALILEQVLDRTSRSGTTDLPCVAAVCDGCGGYAGGGLAAETVLSVLAQVFPEKLADPQVLQQVLETAKETVYGKKREFPQYKGMCTTLAGCVFCEDRTILFHAGDSRIYRYDGASLARMTVDHSVVQSLVDAGRMSEEESRISPQRNTIHRCIGIDCPPPEIYLSHTPIAPGEIFLLCSDGFWESVPDGEIKELLAGGGSAAELAERLVAAALEGGSDDNITVCLCVCQGSRVAVEVTPFILD